jgi:lipoprotein-anchoring transpeptidase ErfK/SrfK
VNASVAFKDGGYAASKAQPGSKVDTDALASSLSRSLTAAPGKLAVKATTEPVQAPLSTATATTTAEKLNGMLSAIGFYVGAERTVPVAPEVAASWLTVTPNAQAGTFSITADQAKIQIAVDALPGQVNRAAVAGEAIVNSSGEALKTIVAGQTARTLGETGTVAKSFATQLSHGEATFPLPVTEEALQTKNVQRSIEVDLGAQRTSMIENGAVVDSWPISAGLAGTPTPTGHFKVFAHVRVQTMSSTQYGYNVPNVEWVMYFSGDDAFHGVYWHNNFGSPMSHGCVGMPISQAQALYEWSPDGIEVYVH